MSAPVRAPKPTTHDGAGDQPASITPSSSVTLLCATLSPSSVYAIRTGTNSSMLSDSDLLLQAHRAPMNHTSTSPSPLSRSTDRPSPAPRSSKYVCGMSAPMLKLMPSPPTAPPPMYTSKSATNSVIAPMSGTSISAEPVRWKSASVSWSMPPQMRTSSSACGVPKSCTPLAADAKSSCTSEPEPVASATGDLHRSSVVLKKSATTLVCPKRHSVSTRAASTKPSPCTVSTVPPSTGPDTGCVTIRSPAASCRLSECTDALWYVYGTPSLL